MLLLVFQQHGLQYVHAGHRIFPCTAAWPGNDVAHPEYTYRAMVCEKKRPCIQFHDPGQFRQCDAVSDYQHVDHRNVGLADGVAILGCGTIDCVCAICTVGVRNRPEEMGLEPDGSQSDDGESTEPAAGTVLPEAKEDWTLKEAMRTWAFWGILISVGIPAMINTGITFHIISILTRMDCHQLLLRWC